MTRKQLIIGLCTLVVALGLVWAQQPVTSVPSSLAVNAFTPFHNAAITTTTTVKSSAGSFYGFYIYNPNSSTCTVELFNTTSPTLGTTSPVVAYTLPATAAADLVSPIALANFSTAISVAAVTADGGSTTCTTGVQVDFYYK